MGIDNYFAFIVTGYLLVMTPGMDTLLVLNKAITQGKKSGVYTTLGISSGILFHTFLGAIGLSMLIANSTIAFAIIKYLGAAFIIYLGIMKFMEKRKEIKVAELKTSELGNTKKSSSIKNDFITGLFTNILNPKVAVLFLAFFPQFINPNHLESPLPFIFLGTTMAIIGITWFLSLTFFSNYFTKKFKSSKNSKISLNKISGVIFIIMGLSIAFADISG